MNKTRIIVTLAGVGLIALLVWYFWLREGGAVATRNVAGGVQEIDVTVNGGYQPATVNARAGQLVRLKFTRKESAPCGEEVVLPDFGKRAHLPQDETVPIEVKPEKPGEYEFTCGMDMYKGRLIVE